MWLFLFSHFLVWFGLGLRFFCFNVFFLHSNFLFSVEAQKKKREDAIKQKKVDDEHALQVAKEGMVGTEGLYDLKQEEAAQKIENKFRQKKAKKRVQELREKKAQTDAAIKLEAVARGKRDRKKVEQMKKEKQESEEAAAAAAAAADNETEEEEEEEENETEEEENEEEDNE